MKDTLKPDSKNIVLEHQDLKPVVFTNKKARIQNNGTKNQNRIVPKHPTSVNATSSYIGVSNVRKLDDSTSSTKHKMVSQSFSRALQQARCGKQMTQLDLANALNQPHSVIKNYESGKAMPNGNFINKMNQVLGVKLPSIKK